MDHEDKPFSRDELEAAGGVCHPDPLTARLLEAAAPGTTQRHGDCCSIRLWSEWPQMLDALPSLGEMLVATGNDCAILGERRIYPEMEFGESFRCGRGVDGSLAGQFVPWHVGFAACHHHPDGCSHSVEFRDEANAVLHKICLTENSLRDRFVDWVDFHQAIPSESRMTAAFSPARWRTVPQRHWFDYDEIEQLPSHALEGILRFAAEQRAPVCVVVGNEGMEQRAELAPGSIQARQQWIFASDDRVGLHFDPSRLGDHILHHAPAHTGDASTLSLKSFNEDGDLRLALSAPPHLSGAEWTAFLAAAIRSL